MTLATSAELLVPASLAGRAVGAFNVILLEHAEALVDAAERAALPIVLQISQNCVSYHEMLAPLATACLRLAASARQSVAVQLDHATSRVALVDESLSLGLTAVMFDGSDLDYATNVAETALVVEACHGRGVSVEAELGVVGGKGGVHSATARTDPQEAGAFVAATRVDALAVAVGTRHRMTTRNAALDLNLIERLREAADRPLVLHGSSGVSDQDLRLAVRAGIAKVNVATHLNAIFTTVVREQLRRDRRVVDPRAYLAPARKALSEEAERLLVLFAGG